MKPSQWIVVVVWIVLPLICMAYLLRPRYPDAIYTCSDCGDPYKIGPLKECTNQADCSWDIKPIAPAMIVEDFK